MKQLVLDLLGCPECWGDFRLSVFVEQKSEIIEGFLDCSRCGRRFPVIGGVPRVMPDHLMGRVYTRYRPFFEKHAASFENLDSTVRGAASTEESYVEETQLIYSYQHTNWSKPQDPNNLMGQWRGFFFDRLAVGPTFFNGKVGLDAGCGEGRYLMVASEHCAEIVGMDLSEGVDRAFAKNFERSNVNVVQGDILHPAFRKEVFDFIYSTGVLHHLPVPKQGCAALAPHLKPGAQMVVWVYNLAEANLLYRLSHFTWLRRVTPRLPPPLQVALSYGIAMGLELFAFLPARLAAKAPSTRGRVPAQLAEVASLPFQWKVKEVHDRIAVPVTNFISRDELDKWFKDNQFTDVEIISKTRGLSAIGRRSISTTA